MRYTGARVAYYGMLAAAVILFGVGVVLMLGTSGASIWQHRSGLSPDEPTRDGSSMDLSQYGDGSYPIGANTKSPQGILIEPEDGQSWWIETTRNSRDTSG